MPWQASDLAALAKCARENGVKSVTITEGNASISFELGAERPEEVELAPSLAEPSLPRCVDCGVVFSDKVKRHATVHDLCVTCGKRELHG